MRTNSELNMPQGTSAVNGDAANICEFADASEHPVNPQPTFSEHELSWPKRVHQTRFPRHKGEWEESAPGLLIQPATDREQF